VVSESFVEAKNVLAVIEICAPVSVALKKTPGFQQAIFTTRIGKQSLAATANGPRRYDIDLPIRIEKRNFIN
jgi:hypothetical protein